VFERIFCSNEKQTLFERAGAELRISLGQKGVFLITTLKIFLAKVRTLK
jgi:hypothetical protein